MFKQIVNLDMYLTKTINQHVKKSSVGASKFKSFI
jgi:hypothetical protein